MIRFRCVDDQKVAGFAVTAACEAAGVSTSGYYDWRAREAARPAARQVADAELVEMMREIYSVRMATTACRACTQSRDALGRW